MRIAHAELLVSEMAGDAVVLMKQGARAGRDIDAMDVEIAPIAAIMRDQQLAGKMDRGLLEVAGDARSRRQRPPSGLMRTTLRSGSPKMRRRGSSGALLADFAMRPPGESCHRIDCAPSGRSNFRANTPVCVTRPIDRHAGTLASEGDVR